jgi:hypothetical protein
MGLVGLSALMNSGYPGHRRMSHMDGIHRGDAMGFGYHVRPL